MVEITFIDGVKKEVNQRDISTVLTSEGLGDTISNITHRLGFSECRGCGERRKLLNRLVPYKQEEDK